jgi:hypothetical protein
LLKGTRWSKYFYSHKFICCKRLWVTEIRDRQFHTSRRSNLSSQQHPPIYQKKQVIRQLQRQWVMGCGYTSATSHSWSDWCYRSDQGSVPSSCSHPNCIPNKQRQKRYRHSVRASLLAGNCIMRWDGDRLMRGLVPSRFLGALLVLH